MKAAVLRSPGHLDYCDFPAPVPGKKDLLIKVHACGVCGTDVKTYRHGHRFIEYPRILGHELSGEVVEAGQDVSSFSPGDRVQVAAAIPCGKCYFCLKNIGSMCENLTVVSCHYHGGFAELMLVPENFMLNGCVNRIPGNLSYRAAALAEPLACVINGQELSGVKEGDVMLIIGAGPLGCLHAETASAAGAKKIILCDTDEKRLSSARFTKAARFVNPLKESVKAAVREAAGGKLADHVMVVSGSAAPEIRPVELSSPRGTVNLFGGFRTEQLAPNLDMVQYGERRLVGSYGSAPRHNRQALSIMSSGKISAENYITNLFPLSKILEALDSAEKRQGLKNMVVPEP